MVVVFTSFFFQAEGSVLDSYQLLSRIMERKNSEHLNKNAKFMSSRRNSIPRLLGQQTKSANRQTIEA